MGEAKNTQGILIEAIKALESLTQREDHAERLQKMAVDATKKIQGLESSIKEAEGKLKALEAEKEVLIASSHKQAADIVKQAKATLLESETHLANAKTVERQAKEHLLEAENTRQAHESILKDIQAQKDKLRVALAS